MEQAEQDDAAVAKACEDASALAAQDKSVLRIAVSAVSALSAGAAASELSPTSSNSSSSTTRSGVEGTLELEAAVEAAAGKGEEEDEEKEDTEMDDKTIAVAKPRSSKRGKRRKRASSSQQQGPTNPLVQSLSRFHAQGSIFVERIEDLAEERQDFKEAYFRAKRDETMFRRQLHRIRDGGSAIKRLQSRVRQLEHRQYVASTRQTNLIGDYARLREKIDHSRREVQILDEKIRDLDNDVIERKEEVARIVAASRVAFTRRGEAMAMIQQLEKRHQEAATEFEREWDALSKVMTAKENRYKMEFSKLRLGMPTQAKEIEKKILEKVQRDEKKLKIAVATGNWATARTRIAPHIYNEKVHTFEDSFKKVQQLTGARNLEDLAEIMAASEDKNYRAFQHLAAMNTEASSLEASVAGLHAQLDESKHHTGAYSAFKRRVIQDLRDDCDNIRAEADELELASNGLSEAFETFRPHLRDIFAQAQCDSLPLPEHFSIDELSDSEVLQCLGLVEQRVNEILHVFACVASVAREKAKTLDSYQTFHSVTEDAGLAGQSSKDASRRGCTNPEATAARAALLSPPTDAIPRVSVASVVGPSKPKRDRTIRVTPPKLEDHDVQEVDPNDPFRDADEVHRPWHRDNQGSSLHLHFYSS